MQLLGRLKRYAWCLCVALTCSSSVVSESAAAGEDFAAWKTKIAQKEQMIGKRLVKPPTGKFYSATVPDTLDLAERAALGINCLTSALSPDYGYEVYFIVHFDANPAYMRFEVSGFPTNNPKFAGSLPMVRLMSGSSLNSDVERAMLERMLAMVGDDGLYYSPIVGRPWHQWWHPADGDFANIYGNARFMLAMMSWYEYDNNPMWKQYIGNMAAGLHKIARSEGDIAYFPDPKYGEPFSYPKSGYQPNLPEPTEAEHVAFTIPMYMGGVLRAMARWSAMSGDKETLEFARKLANYLHQSKLWTVETQPVAMAGSEQGHFTGHFHGHAAALRGLLEYAIVADDAGLKEFVRNGYEYARSFGISRIGWFPENATKAQRCETCCIADMIALAIKLSDAGVGDYWEDVDRYVRNQLVEQQLLSKELLQKVSDSSPARKVNPPAETDDRVIERNIGGFAGYGDTSTLPNTWIMQCCTGNGCEALYSAWNSIVKENGNGTAQINLLLNRASPWMDIDSYLPYEGKVVIKNKKAKRIFVRIPDWVSRKDVRCRVGSKAVDPQWLNNYLEVGGLKSRDTVTIQFPMSEEACKYTLDGATYTFQLRGNTVVDVSPRSTSGGYPIYLRDGMRGDKAPMVEKTRYILEGRRISD